MSLETYKKLPPKYRKLPKYPKIPKESPPFTESY